MSVNKVIYDGRTLIDISDSTIMPSNILEGVIGYGADGMRIVGTMTSPTVYAAISVIYPSGATLICTNGTKTLTAGDTSGRWMFSVPEAGDWTVTAAMGSQSASSTASITAQGQHEVLTLSFTLVLFDSGEYADVTGGFSTINSTSKNLQAYAGSSSTSGATGSSYSKSLIDLSAYTALHFQIVTSSQTHNGTRQVGVSSVAGSSNSNFLATLSNVSTGEQTLDISGITVPVAILLYARAWPYTSGTWAQTDLQISKVWAE